MCAWIYERKNQTILNNKYQQFLWKECGSSEIKDFLVKGVLCMVNIVDISKKKNTDW
jgi:hypothetical protein